MPKITELVNGRDGQNQNLKKSHPFSEGFLELSPE